MKESNFGEINWLEQGLSVRLGHKGRKFELEATEVCLELSRVEHWGAWWEQNSHHCVSTACHLTVEAVVLITFEVTTHILKKTSATEIVILCVNLSEAVDSVVQGAPQWFYSCTFPQETLLYSDCLYNPERWAELLFCKNRKLRPRGFTW